AEETVHAVTISARSYGDEFYNYPFLFKQCKEDTKMVVFDEVCTATQMRETVGLVSRPVEVNRKGNYPFEISPDFIIVCSSNITADDISSMGEEFTNKIDLLQL